MAAPKGTLPANFVDLTDQPFNRLTVRSYLGKSKWRCQCSCGNYVNVSAGNLKTHNTKSCGCFRREHTTAQKTKHGCARTPEYKAWCELRGRCYNTKLKSYHRYGGRGIRVCERWLNSFPDFLEDMGLRPSNKHSIDRKETNGHYTPENCRWATKKEQARNRRVHRWITYKGITKRLCEWAEECGLTTARLHSRLKAGWSVPKALTVPLRR